MNHATIHLGIAATIVVGGTALSLISLRPDNTLWGPVHYRGDASIPRYALTFDDGPTRGATDRILDTLCEFRAPAAFFVVGRNVQTCPDLVARMHAEGHLVANHSYDHSHFGMLRGPWYWKQQIEKTDAAIEQIIGRRPAMFRPPMGFKTPFVNGAAGRHQQAVITWNRRAVDGITTTPERILSRLLPHTRAGDVLMLHDGIEPNSRRDPRGTVAAVKPLILQLREKGLEPARLDDVLKLPAYQEERNGE